MFFTISSKTNESGEVGMTFKPSRSGRSRAILALLVLVVPGLLAAQGCVYSTNFEGENGGQGTGGSGPRVGQLAPDFTLMDLDGDPITLSDYRGKIVFLNFWATWCPPCRQEMPAIESFYNEHKDEDVVVIGVDLRETVAEVRHFIEEGGYTWTFVIDTNGQVNRDYRVIAIPASFFLDREGVIRAKTVGPMTRQAMEASLSMAMN
jgi:peroxiredoxin